MDCLVTKLKASVTDATLPKLGEFTFPISAGNKCSFNFNEGVIDVVGDGVGTVGGSVITFPFTITRNTLLTITSVAGCTVIVKNKYEITRARYVSADIYVTDLLYSPLTELSLYRVNPCTISDINKFTNVPKIILSTPNNSAPKYLSGAVDDLFPNGNTNLTELTLQRTNCTANGIASLGRFTSLTNLDVSNNANITGDIDTVLDAMFTNGRTSGTITVTFNQGVFSTSGIAPGSTITFSSSGWSLDS